VFDLPSSNTRQRRKTLNFETIKFGSFQVKKILIAAAAFAAVASTSFAADLPARVPVKAAPLPSPAMSWTGCYLGAGGGYGMWNQDHDTFVAGALVFTGTTGGRGWFGTVQGGCDYQFNENWVVGVFADYDRGSIRGDFNDVTVGAPLVGREKLTWSWAVGGRVGYLISPQFLTYVAGGYTEANFDQINLSTVAGVLTAVYPENSYTGWFIGTGYEYRLPWFSGLTWKTEYRFSDFDSERLARFTPAGALTTVSMDSHKYSQAIRSELVWRFNWWR
jgi:outer membrane immunogenic protein